MAAPTTCPVALRARIRSCRASPPAPEMAQGGSMRIIGMDVHRSFAQVAILEDGQIRKQFRVDLVHHRLVAFAKALGPEDEVVIEATGNSAAVERLMRPFVRRVVIANSR